MHPTELNKLSYWSTIYLLLRPLLEFAYVAWMEFAVFLLSTTTSYKLTLALLSLSQQVD